jgi:hypothetical protein
MARSYKRDGSGRFAGGGGGGGGKGGGSKAKGGGASKPKAAAKPAAPKAAPKTSTARGRAATMAKGTVNERKRAINKQVGELRRNGGGYNQLPAKTRYINSQNATARAETGFRGKGSKAARRMRKG